MEYIRKKLQRFDLCDESLAEFLGVSLEMIQNLSGEGDLKLSDLRKIATGLRYPPGIIDKQLARLFELPVDSVEVISEGILRQGEESWKIYLFNFVDAFRSHKEVVYIQAPPVQGISRRMEALIASTVESLCEEQGISIPNWCYAVLPLDLPWFVSEMQSLKAFSLMESPIHFRKRNIFVTSNFLSRV